DDGLIGDRPNAGGAAEQITVRLALLDIDDVDDRTQRFDVDAYFELSWSDPRLAVEDVDSSVARVRTVGLDEIWDPGLTIINNRGMRFMLPQVASVTRDGSVTVRQRMSGPLAVDLKLQRFPFDTQRLSLDIVSYRYAPDQLEFAADSELVANPENFSAGGWRFEALDPEFSVFRLTDDGRGTSKLSFALQAERNSGYFVLTLALPMALILFMAWMVHWIQPDVIPARMGMSTATVFSLIALGVSFRLTMPRIDYLTRADQFVIYSTLLVLLSLGATVLATRWVNAGRVQVAERITAIARWSFPAVFLLVIVATLGA
ncbi:MAG: hypothetical protein AAFX10_13800, partial [Pseudomonadota bacterium]